ncbi:hypothetical protein DAKH74_046820 [Maudiozyma humilis]|uniref:PA14 domain-containing protein n=1 Tax=Maudiozyma humilis TaxID=51915 RepID=A0AAV5S2W8_MAUHU|nr:hypothetical protein DAKH74_046820 [Kazachstania humilis]
MSLGWRVEYFATDFSTDKSDLYDFIMNIAADATQPKPLKTITGVTNMDFDIPALDPELPQIGTVFGESITTTNFSLEIHSFFHAPMDGEYTFTIDATDGIMISAFPDMSLLCCENLANLGTSEDPFAGRILTVYIPNDPEHNNNTFTWTMKEGINYLLDFMYSNLSGDAKLKITVTLPTGETISDFAGYVGQESGIDCDNVHTTSWDYSDWTFDSTSTYSSTVVTVDMTTTTTLETIYYVVTPTAASSSIVESSSSEVPLTSDVSSEVPLTSDVSSEDPITSDVSSEDPVTSDVSSEVPLTSDVSSEAPLTSDLSSDTPLTSTNEPTDITSEPSGTSELESSISASTEESQYSATSSEGTTAPAEESSTLTVLSETYITSISPSATSGSATSLPEWYSSIGSSPFSSMATESVTATSDYSTDSLTLDITETVETGTVSSSDDSEAIFTTSSVSTVAKSTEGSGSGMTSVGTPGEGDNADESKTLSGNAHKDDTTTTVVATATCTTVCPTSPEENTERTIDGNANPNEAANKATNEEGATKTIDTKTQKPGVVTAVTPTAAYTKGDSADVSAVHTDTIHNTASTNGGTTSLTEVAFNNGANGEATLGAIQAADSATTTLIGGSNTPALYSPEDDNAAARMSSNMIVWVICLFLFI